MKQNELDCRDTAPLRAVCLLVMRGDRPFCWEVIFKTLKGWVGGGGHITWGSFKINFMKVGQGGNKRELKSNVALTAVNSKYRSYITTVDKVCDELRHYL